MFSSKLKSLILKALLYIFVSDSHKLYHQRLETKLTQQQMEHLLRAISSAELLEAQLHPIAERMENLQKSIRTLCAQGLSDETITKRLNRSVQKIQKNLNGIEEEIHALFRHMK